MPIDRRTLLALTAGAVLLPARAFTQTFPTKPVRIIVPYPPGGPTDVLARILADDMRASLGGAVIVENRAGASGAVGTREAARSDPDGHTIVLGTNQTHVTNAFLLKDAGYDPIKDFAPVAGVADLQHVLVTSKALGAATAGELIARARKEPGKLNYGSTGAGSGSHLAMELFKTKTGTEMQHVPFRGAAPMVLELVAGRIDASFATLPSVLGQIQAGEIRALALASHVPAPQLPDLPLLKTQGVIDGEADAWLALFAPRATPALIMAKLSQAVVAALAKPDVVQGAIKQGIAVNVRPPQAFAAYHAGEMTKWAEVVRVAQVKVD